MASEYTYDEGNETWPFFAIALLSFVLVPLSIQWVLQVIQKDDPVSQNRKLKGSITETAETLSLDSSKSIKSFQRTQKKSRFFNKKLLVIVVGWSIVVFIALNYVQEADLKGSFDPYMILDVSRLASEREVKSRYKKLSLKFHPDKVPKDLTDTQREQMESDFIKINLAYKALTDEVTRNNFLQYGHPDGPQDVSHGIAIPKFLVEGKYSSLVVAIYFLLIGVLLPFIVGRWWNSVKTYTRKGLHVETASLFTRKFADRNPTKLITEYDILDWLVLTQEVQSAFSYLEDNQIKDLINQHLLGNYNLDSTLEIYKLQIVSLLPKLLDGLIDIAMIFRQYDVIITCCNLRQCIYQGVKAIGKHQELLQLPFVDRDIVEKQSIKRLGKLFTLNDEELSAALGIKDSKKLETVKNIASRIPQLRVLEAEFHVPGEDVVPPLSNAHLNVKFLVKSPGLKSCPKIDGKRLEEEETLEIMKNPFKSNEDQPPLPFAFTPRFPRPVRTLWTGFMINQKDNKIVEGSSPEKLTNIDLSNIELTQEEWVDDIDGGVKISSFKLPLTVPVPPNEGRYHFRLILKNNTYFGCDVDIPLELNVKSPPMVLTRKPQKQEDDSDDESDISDPEEDTIAGALAALRGENVKKVSKSEKASDESDTEDNESVFTDINTDTEDEAES